MKTFEIFCRYFTLFGRGNS